MKTNKKAILGFAVAMIFSLGFMQGMSTKSNHDITIQQLGLGCAMGSACAEDGGALQAGLEYGANVCTGLAVGMGSAGAHATLATGGAASANPVGAAYWITTGVIGL
ncbi:hypothetical protein K4L44_04325 [Halosquirtibacter laminarini]|uniref:Uncharacterized protein n=1 Tax=Halosquirtibacter laminarini TaxID=3374600 RepID=A0AC61NLS0_9BACT|nr:hypothetical protein K4L44_04325 [Prolixibacteraceae bacterium]